MSAKTWLLSATALMTTGEALSETTVYTPVVRSDVAETMKNDSFSANETAAFFLEESKQHTSPTPDRKETAKILKQQNASANETISNIIAPRTEVVFNNQKPGKDSARGEYVAESDVINVKVGNKEDGAHYTEAEISIDKLLTLLHELHHQYCAHIKTKNDDGKEIFVQDLPMSLQQVYMTEQANETGSHIASCMGLRQLYIEAKTEYNQSKQDILKQWPKGKEYKELKSIIEKDLSYTVEAGKVKFKDKKGKDIVVDISQLGPEMEAKLKDNQQKRLKCDNILNGNYTNQTYEEYINRIKEGKIDPLNPNDFEKEMEIIGTSVAKSWQKNHAGTKNAYDMGYRKQCSDMAVSYLKDHDIEDIKPNEENFDKALSAMLTIGGYDFSEYVKPELKCNDWDIVRADKNLANGSTKINALSLIDGLVHPKYVTQINGRENQNEFKALDLTKNAKNGDKIENLRVIYNGDLDNNPKFKKLGTILSEMKEGITKPVIWNEEDATIYKKTIADFRKGMETYSPEDKQKIEQKINELGLDQKKVGERLTEEELAKFTKLCNTIKDVSKNYGTLPTIIPALELDKLYRQKQIESIPILCEYCKFYEELFKQNRTNIPSGDEDYFYPDPVRLKEMIVRELSGEGDKLYENKAEARKEDQERKFSTITMMDFSQPFLTEQEAGERAASAQKRIASATSKSETTEELKSKQPSCHARVGTAVRDEGR